MPKQDMWVQSLIWGDLLEKEMGTHSSFLAWRFSRTEKPDWLQSTGSQRAGHGLMMKQQQKQFQCYRSSPADNQNYVTRFFNNSYHLYNDCDVKCNILNPLHIIPLIATQKYTNKFHSSFCHCHLSLTVEGAKAESWRAKM